MVLRWFWVGCGIEFGVCDLTFVFVIWFGRWFWFGFLVCFELFVVDLILRLVFPFV